mmetsp:Transcript_15130/g.32811  ORF Transcript_15130/g.32811 Transcript_15130/m.32811 type:complete len:509 (+) Transcript_15130:114-1640(+)|eukprot:CAMPEP_0202911802 /NCGR_PEP_ID=MMETSP1392-20130828/55975_1 /ASSEMBLY_ACC=CAM_ASM_000868 /TAXON_ID=225041 /ORGANISM="Chlamydomonas chlamydogama, Strain SAG 11-48b" /LENGTH=508 /DNA_ID=CAMNT_0049602453 /DNA_START=106 /DNA_END=1632 /DNA_ORIENTATION=-
MPPKSVRGQEKRSSEENNASVTTSTNVAHNIAEAASRNVPSRVRVRRRAAAPSLLRFNALPDYLRDNEFIQGHYRTSMKLKDTLWSLFGLHNETGNIYTHLLGFVLFVGLTVYMTRAPPTPLAFGKHQLDELWHSVRDNIQQLRDNVQLELPKLPTLQGISENLHHLQDSLQERVHIIQEGLSESLHSLQEGLSERVSSFQEGLSERVHSIHEGLSDRVHSIQDGLQHNLHQLSDSLVTSHLYESLGGVLTWPTARWPTYVYMAGAMTCLMLSSVCHLLGCCQRHIALFIWRLDYAGIAILIVTSFYPTVYYGFMCKPYALVFYLTCVTIMGCGAVMVSLMERFQQREWRFFRAGMFLGLGLFGIGPVVHQWFINRDVYHVRLALAYDLLMGAIYIMGAFVFALRVPERWFPGKFDLFLHSHQIFHVAVVAAAVIHYRSVMLMLEWRDASGGCAVPVTSGPVSYVLQEMRDLGHDLLSIDEVWSKLKLYAHEMVGLAGHMAPTVPAHP